MLRRPHITKSIGDNPYSDFTAGVGWLNVAGGRGAGVWVPGEFALNPLLWYSGWQRPVNVFVLICSRHSHCLVCFLFNLWDEGAANLHGIFSPQLSLWIALGKAWFTCWIEHRFICKTVPVSGAGGHFSASCGLFTFSQNLLAQLQFPASSQPSGQRRALIISPLHTHGKPPEQSNQSYHLLIKSPQESVWALEQCAECDRAEPSSCPQTRGQWRYRLPAAPSPSCRSSSRSRQQVPSLEPAGRSWQWDAAGNRENWRFLHPLLSHKAAPLLESQGRMQSRDPVALWGHRSTLDPLSFPGGSTALVKCQTMPVLPVVT